MTNHALNTSQHPAVSPPLRRDLLDMADQCVKCGLCLPHCPTYRLFGVENEAPRGRISLAQGLLSGQIGASTQLRTHLDHCLHCLACERVCPSYVTYGRLIDEVKTWLEPARPSLKKRFLLHGLLARRDRMAYVYRLLYWYQRLCVERWPGVAWLLRRLHLSAWAKKLPPLASPPRWRTHYPASDRSRKIGLFLGCLNTYFDQKTLQSAIFVLNKLGFELMVPAGQTCCGALYAHNGDMDAARRKVKENVAVFHEENVQTVVYTASGCGAFFREYAHYLGQQPPLRFVEIQQFILEQDALHNIDFRPRQQTVAVHVPCTLRNALRQPELSYRLLERIPGIRLAPLPENAFCCGAAGSYMLTYGDIAAQLLAPKLDGLMQMQADCLVTCNIGCALHFQSALRERAQSVPVLHAVELLAQQWPHSSAPGS